MKRRNVDCAKIRRPVKRNKITEGIFGSSLLYLKFLLLWVFVMGADYMLEFRFEFLWPFWLLLRSVYDSFKYQGLAFSVFFVCIALTSDMICFFFIPVNWLFFAASTYVWVQYVWHTDKGICLPTIVLWILFVYLEAAVRLREMRNLPFHLDLCRPFAAHCIGYPVVTLGFGFKSYVGYRMRQRKQRDVAKENEFYTQLLQQALPVDEVSTQLASTVADPTVSLVATEKTQTSTAAQIHTHTSRHEKSREKNKSDAVTNSVPNGPSNATVLHNGTLHNGAVHNGVVHNGVLCNAPSKNSHRKSVDKANNDHKHQHLHENHTSSEKNSDTKKYSLTNGSVIGNHTDSEYIEKSHHETDDTPSELPEKLERTSTKMNSVRNKSNKENVKENNRENTQHRKKERHRETIDKSQKESSDKASDKSTEKVDKSFENKSEKTESDCVQQRLEWELKKVRTELVSCRHSEQDLRAQVTTLSAAERSNRHELSQIRKENEELQNKVQSLTSARQADRQTVERRLGEERRVRASLEAQLAHERRVQQQAQLSKAECTEQCRARRRELEMEARELRAGTRVAEERVAGVEREKIQQQRDADVLLASLAAAQDKNQHLENSLSAETRIKLDLFSALGETKRQLEIRDSMIRSQEKEIDDLKSKIAQVLAVMPLSGDTFGGGSVGPSSRVRLAESPAAAVGSTLDPNATAYTPKGSLVAGAAEA